MPAASGPASGPRLSVVVPVFNEAENLLPLAAELDQALKGVDHEIILVDDGSTDASWSLMLGLAAKNGRVRGLRLSRNFGQTAALAAGIAEARGGWIATLDADLQNDPADLARLLAKMEEGYDLVSGWRQNRQDAWLTRALPSRIANKLISMVTGVSLHDYGCTLKVYKREFIQPLRLMGEMHRFAPALAASLGARLAEAPVNHRPRSAGKSKYGLERTLKVLLDLLTVKFMDAYLGKPIYFFGGSGFALATLGAGLACVTLYKKLFLHVFVKDQPLFLVSIFLALVGIQLILLGLVAEILVRVYYDIKDKRPYIVRETTPEIR